MGDVKVSDLADLSRCSMFAWGLKSSSGVFFFISMWTPWIQLQMPWEREGRSGTEWERERQMENEKERGKGGKKKE